MKGCNIFHWSLVHGSVREFSVSLKYTLHFENVDSWIRLGRSTPTKCTVNLDIRKSHIWSRFNGKLAQTLFSIILSFCLPQVPLADRWGKWSAFIIDVILSLLCCSQMWRISFEAPHPSQKQKRNSVFHISP